jgi:hypothetical protein
MAPSTARSSGGSASASSIASGPCCLRPARTWAAATGRGWRPMTRRARPGGGAGRPRPDGSREGRREAQPSSGGGWQSADCGGRGRELAGPESAGRHARRGGAERPQPEPDWPQQLCLDKGDDDEDGWGAGLERNHVPHIRVIRDPRPLRKRRCKPRRWVGRGTDAGLAVEVPVDPDPLGQAGPQLPRPAQARVRPDVVQSPPPADQPEGATRPDRADDAWPYSHVTLRS